MLQPTRQRQRELLAARLLVALFGRQEQPRFQVSEPRRHDEVVGGELDPQPARRLDEGEVLLGERQDRDLCEIDLLVARKLEQKVERTFEAGDIDDEALVGADDRRLEIVDCGSGSATLSSFMPRRPASGESRSEPRAPCGRPPPAGGG